MSVVFSIIVMFALVGVCYPTPWHKKIKLSTRWRNVGLFVLGCILVGVTSPSQPTKVTADKEKIEVPTQQPQEVPAKEKLYKIGENVDVSNRSFKVNSVEETSEVKDPMGTKYPAGDGSRFIKISITVKNQRKQETSIMSDEVKLLTKDGTEYSTDQSNEVWVNEAGQSFFFNTLNPGVSKTANILFAVPKDVKLADLKIKVTDGGLVEDNVKYISLVK